MYSSLQTLKPYVDFVKFKLCNSDIYVLFWLNNFYTNLISWDDNVRAVPDPGRWTYKLGEAPGLMQRAAL